MKNGLIFLFFASLLLLPPTGRGRFQVIGNRTASVGVFPYEKDSTIAFHFQFVNAGDSLLTITEVIPTCPCMDVEWTRNPLAPGDTGNIHVNYHVDSPGHFKKMLTVLGNGYPEWDYIYVDGSAIEEAIE